MLFPSTIANSFSLLNLLFLQKIKKELSGRKKERERKNNR
nr:MAG TPA: hypothetical protein [Bacteriophage sp.]